MVTKKRTGPYIIASDKVDFKSNTVSRNKNQYIMIKGSIQKEKITKVPIYAPNIRAPKYIRQTLTDLKGETTAMQL